MYLGNPRTPDERIAALRQGIENAIGLIEYVDPQAAVVELRARLRTDDTAASFTSRHPHSGETE